MQFVKPQPFKEAIEKIGLKTPVGSLLSSKEWRDVPVALRERAFFSSRVESVRFLQRGRDGITDFLSGARETLPDGKVVLKTGSRADFVREMQQFAMAEGLGPLDPKKKGSIQDITGERRLSLIFNTLTQQADDFGAWKQGMDPDVLDAFPAQRFIRVQDVTEHRQAHAPFENQVRLKSDLGFWLAVNRDFGVPWGPWGWGCGHDVEDVDRAESEELQLIAPGQTPEPAEQSFNERLQASVRGLDPDLKQWLKQSLGDSIMLKGNAVWWKGDRRSKALAVPTVPKAAKPVVETPVKEGDDWPEDVDSLEMVRTLGGSTGAVLVQEPGSGRLFVLKRGSSAAHLREEFAADQLYRAAGVPVPEARLYEGKRPVKLARFIEGQQLGEYLRTRSKAEAAAVLAKIREHFGLDALLGNWDVAGLNLDNIVVDAHGTPWRIDNGGALRYRAQGAVKSGQEWDGYPTELWTLRDADKNAQTAKLFGETDIYSIAGQIQRVDVSRFLAAAPEDLRQVLEQRLQELNRVAAKALEYQATSFLATHADAVTRWAMAIRKEGVLDGLADELVQRNAGDYVVYDRNGKPFDNLRTQKGKKQADISANYYKLIQDAAKTVNHHHSQGDTSYNASKIQQAEGLKAELTKLAKKGTTKEQEMANHYLGALKSISDTQGQVKKQVPFVTKFDLPVSAPKADRSVVSEFARWMGENGGDWSVLSDWASAQGGSSKSTHSMAVKYWLMKRLAGATKSSFHNAPGKSAYDALRKKHGDKFERSLEMFQSLIQETLAGMDFPGNDRVAKMVRVMRTETKLDAVPLKPGEAGEYQRGVNESGSIFSPVFSGVRTVTAVPHTRITGLYFFEKTPGGGDTFFYGDSENEVTYIGWRLRTMSLGVNAPVNLKIGKDRRSWEI